MEYPTKAQFKEYGMPDLSVLTEEAISQLESDEFQILVYTEDTTLEEVTLEITAVPKRQLVAQESDIALAAPIQRFTLTTTEQNNSMIRVIMSVDEGQSWKSYSGDRWIDVDINNLDDVLHKGMKVNTLNSIGEEIWKSFLVDLKVRFAYYLDLDKVTDTLLLDKLSYTTIPIVESSPKLEKIEITYKDLTTEGRLKNLERVNAINLSKLNFKSNALLSSHKYKLSDMVVDTCNTKEMSDVLSDLSEKVTKTTVSSEPISLGEGYITETSLLELGEFLKLEEA